MFWVILPRFYAHLSDSFKLKTARGLLQLFMKFTIHDVIVEIQIVAVMTDCIERSIAVQVLINKDHFGAHWGVSFNLFAIYSLMNQSCSIT